MYTQRCFQDNTTKLILTVLSACVMAISVCHFTYAGLFGTLLNFYGDSFFGLDKSLFEKLYAPPIAYFTISGVIQVLVNMFYLGLLWEIIKIESRKMSVAIGLLIFQFGMNFTIAVCSSMSWTYYNGLWKQWLKWTDQYLNTVDQRWRSFHTVIISIFRLSAAESILTFLVVIPIIIIQVLLFLDRNTSYSYLEEAQKKQGGPQKALGVPQATLGQIEVIPTK